MNAAIRIDDEVARLPLPGDNCAIATRLLGAGTVIHHDGGTFTLDYAVMEGHRFAVKAIAAGERPAFLGHAFRRGAASDPARPLRNQRRRSWTRCARAM